MASGLSSHLNAKTIFFSQANNNLLNRGYMPGVAAMTQNQSYWASIEADIQTYLGKAIPIRSPKLVFEPMHHLTFAAPRTTASALCVAACELVGGDRSRAMEAASAIHLMHAAAYIHEHLPLTDRPRPQDTIQYKYNPNTELLMGDGIIPFGMELLARSMDLAQNNQDKILGVIIEISRASGSQGIVDGQYQELEIHHDSDWEIIEYVCRKKEGALHACGAACGAILGGGAEEEIKRLRNFGAYAGTVRGMVAKNNPGILEGNIRKLSALALKELESFQGEKLTELIATLAEPTLCTAAE